MYIEGISLEYFSAVPKIDNNSTTPSRQRHAVFHCFYMTIANRMLLLPLHTAKIDLISQRQKILTPSLSKIWENRDGCSEKYRCDSAL